MGKTLLIILVANRSKSAVSVQKALTEFGCIIKTRLGIHDGVLTHCSNTGLIILELVGEKARVKKLAEKINGILEVKAKLVEISLK
ncbi:MAG: hypothetical protein V1933_02165 [Candidatus Omnitrophota bacterium]